MNLIYLHGRASRDLSCPDGTASVPWSWGGTTWRALSFPNLRGNALRLGNFVDNHPMWTRPDTPGWFAASRGGAAKLEVMVEHGGEVVARVTVALSKTPVPVPLPWPDPSVPLGPETTLVLRAAGGGAREIAILVHRVLSRQHLYDLAKGTGIEVGPGPNPQIRNSRHTRVIYMEEMPPEKWAELYDPAGRHGATTADWSEIRIGKAAELPVEDGSQDFIFASHVFEHLANPLGHLERWHAKLRPGGVVLAVVPDMGSTNDRFMRPSTLGEILEEHAAGIFEPQAHHYERFAARGTGGRVPEPKRARAMMERSESIHVHFYDREGIAEVLQAAVDRLGYRGFRITHTQNHKDFHFALRR